MKIFSCVCYFVLGICDFKHYDLHEIAILKVLSNVMLE